MKPFGHGLRARARQLGWAACLLATGAAQHGRPSSSPSTATDSGKGAWRHRWGERGRSFRPLPIAVLWALGWVSQSVHASTNCTGNNATANFIQGTISENGDDVAAAMNWVTGLVWQRCSVGQTGADCSGGAATTMNWDDWNATYAPLDGAASPPTDRLASGAWRLPYKNELLGLRCGHFINEAVFPNTQSWYWSASRHAYIPNVAWFVGFDGVFGSNGTTLALHIRLVRSGQSFDALGASAHQTQSASPTSVVTFTPTPVSAPSGTTAWGGARITGDGSPEFQVNGAGAWAKEAIVKSTDQLTVRMTAANAGTTRTATLTLRSGETTTKETTDTTTWGDGATTLRETSATFTLSSVGPQSVTGAANPPAGGTVECPASAVTYGQPATCNIDTNEGYHLVGASSDTCGGSLSNDTFSIGSITQACTVTAQFVLIGSTDTGTGIQTAIGGTAGCVFSAAPTWAAPGAARVPLPSGYSFPYGELTWSAQGCTAGGTAVITVTLPGALPAGARLFKWVNGAWTGWPLTRVNGNPNAFTYSVTDNASGDSNTTGGAITDPAMLAVPLAVEPEPVPVPTLGQWALALLGLIAAGLGLRCLRGV